MSFAEEPLAWEMWRTRSSTLKTDVRLHPSRGTLPQRCIKTQRRRRSIEGIVAQARQSSERDQIVKHLTAATSADRYLHDVNLRALVSTNNQSSQLIMFISSACHLCARLSYLKRSRSSSRHSARHNLPLAASHPSGVRRPPEGHEIRVKCDNSPPKEGNKRVLGRSSFRTRFAVNP